MSKIGRTPIIIKEGVTVSVDKNHVGIQGPKGTFSYKIPEGLAVKISEGKVVVAEEKVSDEVKKRRSRNNISAMFGLCRATIANMIQGAHSGFEKKLELSGVGYRAQVSGNNLTLSVGFSHPVIVSAPQGLTVSVLENVITVFGSDKTAVGDLAGQIRRVRPPEPYKGKGISYVGERIRRKAGKAVKAVGGK